MRKKIRLSKLYLKRLLIGLMSAGAAVFLCACELPSKEVSYDGKDGGIYQATIVKPEEVIVEEPLEKTDPGYKETGESSLMNFVVLNDFGEMEYFSKEDFGNKNPEVTYSAEENQKASEAYFSYLDELVETGWQVKFDFLYINNDNMAELVYVAYSGDYSQSSSVDFHFCTFDFEKNEVIEIGCFYSKYGGNLYYVEKENLLWYSEWSIDDTVFCTYYVTINKDYKFELVASFERILSTSDSDSFARVNGTDTDLGTLLEYLDCFEYSFSDIKNLDTYTINTMIPLKGNYVFTNGEGSYDNYYTEYDDECIKAAFDVYAEELSLKAEDAGYLFVYLDGDKLPEMFLLLNDRICIYRASIYKDDSDISRYVFEVTNSEFEGNISYAQYNRAIHEQLNEDGNNTDYYSLYSDYECYPMQRYTMKNGEGFFINDFPVSTERFGDLIEKWNDISFTEVIESDFYTNKKESNVKKVFYETIKEYNP